MALRAQYGPGVVGGVRVPGYLEEEGVAPDSRTETYAALRLHVSNWRWAGVPFYLRTGKRLARKLTEIAVILKPIPHMAFQSSGSVGIQANQIVFTRPARRGRLGLDRRQDPGHADADPPGQHGVPLRHVVPVGVAGGLRAADPRRDARRRHAVHAQRRDRGAVGDHRPDPRRLGGGHHVADPPVRGRILGSAGGRRAARRTGESGGGCERGHLVRAGHQSGRHRGRAAGAAARASRGERGAGPGPGAQPGRDRRPRVEGGDRQPAGARRPLPRRPAPSCARSRRGARRSTPSPRSATRSPEGRRWA